MSRDYSADHPSDHPSIIPDEETMESASPSRSVESHFVRDEDAVSNDSSVVQEALNAQISALQQELATVKERMLRIAADADNTRKRLEKEKQDTRTYAIVDFTKDLLPVIDAFERTAQSLSSLSQENQSSQNDLLSPMLEGISMVTKLFYDTLQKHNVQRTPGKDSSFNPLYHNAIARDVVPGLVQETVIEEFVMGFMIGERVLRAALVKVGVPA